MSWENRIPLMFYYIYYVLIYFKCFDRGNLFIDLKLFLIILFQLINLIGRLIYNKILIFLFLLHFSTCRNRVGYNAD